MEVKIQEDSTVVEEAGYAMVDRANKIHANGNEDLALQLRALGRNLIDDSRFCESANDGRLEEEFEDSLMRCLNN